MPIFITISPKIAKLDCHENCTSFESKEKSNRTRDYSSVIKINKQKERNPFILEIFKIKKLSFF